MRFKFDAKQEYQLDAIAATVDLFDGQPSDADQLLTTLRSNRDIDDSENLSLNLDLSVEIGAIGNNLLLTEETILENLKVVQNRNGLQGSDTLKDGPQFDIEMETGTGKTYVYLRTIFELAEKYNFTKFIILVPSVAIREGVKTSIDLMRDHFRTLYPAHPFDASVYSGKTAEEVQSFATSTSVQIMIMTIDSIRGNANTRIIHQTRDKLQGLRPVDYLKSTNPVVIMDEPQNMESKLSQSAIKDLDPACTLRYSATHRKTRNVIYRLDPVDAHEHGLVKQIVVAEATQQGGDATPYIKLVDVKRDPWQAKLELVCRKTDGSFTRQVKTVKQHQDLARITDNPAYENNWRINEISLEPAFVELTNHGVLNLGEEIGGSTEVVYREMIRETIREHFRKERLLRPKGIKVLSLFFVDKVASYLGDGTNNETADGQFAVWFDELFHEERQRHPEYAELLPHEPAELRRAYFSQIKKGVYGDTTGVTAKDDDSYDLIMKEKARLLSHDEPVRFIFSHSALREGWDNPNVFQICTLREMGGETERRQTIGRGLRLPVNQEGERIAGPSVAQLTVVANESYQQFAKSLQQEYVKAGVAIGYVRREEFAKIPRPESDAGEVLGYVESSLIWDQLHTKGFLDKDGRVTERFRPEDEHFTLDLSEEITWLEPFVTKILQDSKIEKFVKQQRKRRTRKLNKQIYASREFEAFWEAISQRTTYKVRVDRDDLIAKSIKAIKQAPDIEPLRVQVTRANLKVVRGGAHGEELGTRSADLRGGYQLPNIINELQEATSLTRQTIIDILVGSGRLDEFLSNPHDFLKLVKDSVEGELADILVEGVQYEAIGGSVYTLRELQKDGEQEKQHFIDHLYKVKNQQKSDFDYVLYDSDNERKFAELLDSREDIKLFMKLPAGFKIDTPVGPYNPDWAIVKHEDGDERIYMIRETKSTADPRLLRPDERAKIESAEGHFKAIGIDYEKSSPENWRI